jgi:hypothetical protein
MKTTITIRISNAAPVWPHELTINNVTVPYDNLERMMRAAGKEYRLGDEVIIENIVCIATYSRTYVNKP